MPSRSARSRLKPGALFAGAMVALLALAPGPRFLSAAEPSPLVPVELRCDWMVDPLGVDSSPPRLSWQLQGYGRRGLRQSAWQVLASSSRDGLERDQGDVWDSERVPSDAQVHVPYGGRPLRSTEEVFWKVRVWDGDGRASAWSRPATWTMGVLEATEWRGRWITDPGLLKWVRPLLGYRSEETETPAAVKWVQVDLGSPHAIQELRFHAVRHTVAVRRT